MSGSNLTPPPLVSLGEEEEDEEEPGSMTTKGDRRDSCATTGVRESNDRVGVRASQPVSVRRLRLQRQKEVSDPGWDPSEKGSLTTAMRKKYLKELFLSNNLSSGFGSILESPRDSAASSSKEWDSHPSDTTEEGNSSSSFWALDPTEHAWMISVVDGNYDTIMNYLSEDFSLLTKKDFISGFTAIHWLAKYGKYETLVKLLRYAEIEGSPVNVNLKAGGGFTPLHIATMHGQSMVIKLLVGAFGADVEAMDYSGRRAWQYLKGSSSVEIRELLGAPDSLFETAGHQNTNNNSSCAMNLPRTEAADNEVQTDSFFRTRDWWRFGSLKKLFAPILHFGNSTRSSTQSNENVDFKSCSD